MDYSTISGFTTFKWPPSRACCPICQTGEPCWGTSTLKVWKSGETTIAPNLHFKLTSYASENTKFHHAWEESYLPEFAMRCPTRMGDLLRTSGWMETLCSSLGSHCPGTTGPVETEYPCNRTQTIKRKKVFGSWPGISHPQFISLYLIVLPGSANMWCAQPGQVPKATNLPLLKARWAYCFLLV